jgi:hypothetical protein
VFLNTAMLLKLKQSEVDLTDEELDNLFDFPEDEGKEDLDIKEALPKSRTSHKKNRRL